MALQAAEAALATDRAPDLFVTLVDENGDAWATQFAHDLRRAGISCEIDLSGRSVKAQMREANRIGARHVVVVGEEERASGEGRIRNMSGGEEITVALTADAVRNKLADSAG